MIKHNTFIKKVKKQFLYINTSIKSYFNKLKFFNINTLIEGYFNRLKYFKSNYKKILFTTNNKVFASLGIVVILTLTYFLLPTFYDKSLIQSEIKRELLKKYDINIKFNNDIIYSLLPKPHFLSKNLSIVRGEKEIGIVKNFKVYIKSGNFFKFNEIEIKDLNFKKTDFRIQKEDFVFFKNLLNVEPNENRVLFKNNNVFFITENEEILFINKIPDGKFYYDKNSLSNILTFKNEVFNVPFNLLIENNKFNKELNMKFSSKKIRLNIKNRFDYDLKSKLGFVDILLINKNTSFNYKLNKDSLEFFSEDTKNSYKGKIDFKPFYFNADFFYEGLSSKNLLNRESIFIDLINSEIINNDNLNAKLNFKIKKITNINELNDLKLSVDISEGLIDLSDSEIMWKEDVKIKLEESYLTYDESQINLNGKVILDFIDLNNFYRSFQVNKNYRKKVKKIEFYFVYDFNKNRINFSNSLIDNNPNTRVENFFEDFNIQGNIIINKIRLKNFINTFFQSYAG